MQNDDNINSNNLHSKKKIILNNLAKNVSTNTLNNLMPNSQQQQFLITKNKCSSNCSNILKLPDRFETPLKINSNVAIQQNALNSIKNENKKSERRKRNSKNNKRLNEKRRLNDTAMEQRISDLIKENLLLKNCLNTENLKTDFNQKKQIPSSVIVAGPSCIQQQKQLQITQNLHQPIPITFENNNNNELNSLNNISQSLLQQTNIYDFSKSNNFTEQCTKNFQSQIDGPDFLINNNNNNNNEKNITNLLTTNFSNIDNAFLNKISKLNQINNNLTNKIDENIDLKQLHETTTNVIASTTTTPNKIITSEINDNLTQIIPSTIEYLNLCDMASASTSTNLLSETNNNNLVSKVFNDSKQISNHITSIDLNNINLTLEQQKQQQLVATAAAATLISNYQAYCESQLLSSLTVNKVNNTNLNVDLFSSQEQMNEKETHHLSAFHPFNQLNFSNNIPFIQSVLPNSSIILPQLNAQNLLSYIESSTGTNNNDLINTIQNKNINFQHIEQPTTSLSSSAAVIVQPTTNLNNNFNQILYPIINNKTQETVPLTSCIKFPIVYSTADVKKTNIENNAIIQHADSSSSSNCSNNYIKNNENLLSIKEKQLESNVRPPVVMHSTNLNLFSNDSENKNKKMNCELTINVSNDNFPTSSTMYQPINETLLQQRSPKEDNLFNYKIKCVLPNNYSNIINSTISSSEPKTLTSELINNLENLVTTKSSDCLNLDNQSYSLSGSTTISKLSIDNQQNNINNNHNNFLNNNLNKNDNSILLTQKTNNLSIQTMNSNYLQNSLSSNTSLLGTLLATTRQSPTVPESRTEQQSGLVGSNNYDLSNNSNNLFLSSQSSLEIQEYLLKQNNQLHQQCESNDMLQSMLSSTTTKQINQENKNDNITKNITLKFSPSFTFSDHSIDTKSDSDHSLLSPQSANLQISSSVIDQTSINSFQSSQKHLINNHYESLDSSDDANDRRNSILSTRSINSDDSLLNQTHNSKLLHCNETYLSMYNSTATSSIESTKSINSHLYDVNDNIETNKLTSRLDIERYMDRRRRNNEAAKRCRANRRAVFEYRLRRAHQLEDENNELRQEMLRLHNELKQLKDILNNGQCVLPNA